MAYSKTTALEKILPLNKRVRVVQGGARAGKTIAILMILIDIAQTRKGKVISVVGESVPFLKRGPIRDFLSILKEQGYFKEARWNKTDYIYEFETGTIIEFFSADNPSKVRGPARNILFINEANNVPYETYTQLAIRTSEYIYLDYNPVAEFYVHEHLMSNDNKDYDFIICTYKDNEALSEEIVKEIESRKKNKNFWQVYGLGLLGEAEGRIYTGWKTVDEIPHEARLERRGLDFGYSNDPTAIVDIYYYNGGYILDEQLYRKGLSNKQIADVINNLPKPQTLVMCDSAEPKSIDELKLYGINAQPVTKGRGSINQGIQFVQDQQISYTKRSLNLQKEYRNYLWDYDDKDGRWLQKPIDMFNHILDAARYGFESLRPQEVHVEEDNLFDEEGFF